MRNPSVILSLSFCLWVGAALEANAALPHVPIVADWVGEEVLAAPGAGGPEKVPRQLFGTWNVSLCVKAGLHRGHAWIRYQNVETGEVHTVGRFQKNVRPTKRRSSRVTLYPRTKESGLHWDYDWRFEHEVRQGKHVVGSVVVRDPLIFGYEDADGHGVIRDNCITYARDAWQYYSGQQYQLAVIHTPEGFLRTIARDDAVTPPTASSREFADEPCRSPGGRDSRSREVIQQLGIRK